MCILYLGGSEVRILPINYQFILFHPDITNGVFPHVQKIKGNSELLVIAVDGLCHGLASTQLLRFTLAK